jgi:hypothetical protein
VWKRVNLEEKLKGRAYARVGVPLKKYQFEKKIEKKNRVYPITDTELDCDVSGYSCEF